ncbi:MAG: TRAP transporter small permease [Pseudomonadota bacterium]
MLDRILTLGDRVLQSLLDMVVIALSGLLLVLLNYAVFTRFILNDSVSWSEELPSHVLAVLAFIGAALLTRTNEHIGFDGVVRLAPPTIQRAVFALNLTLMTAFGVALAWYGGIAATSFGSRALISVDLPMGLFRAAMPLGGGLIALICGLRLVGLVTGRLGPEDLLPETDD